MRVTVTRRTRIRGYIEEIECISRQSGEKLVVRETAAGGFEVETQKPERKEGGT